MASQVLEPVSVARCSVDVKFRVPFRVETGEAIVICGNCVEFGDWIVENAFPLTWTPGNLWTGSTQLDAGTYQFKCVRIRSKIDNSEWEPGENRVLVVQGSKASGGEMEVTIEFGETRASHIIQVIRETVVMGPTGDELFRVAGGVYNLVRLEQLFQPLSMANDTTINVDSIEESVIHDVASNHVLPGIPSINQYLRSTLLFEEDELSELHRRFPNLKFKSIELDIKPWINLFLRDVGLERHQVATLIKRRPSLLDILARDKLKPFVDFFMNDLGVISERLFTLLKRRPALFNRSLDQEIKPRVKMLETMTELEDWDIGRLLVGCTNLFSMSDAEIRHRFTNLSTQLDLDVYECSSLVLKFPPLLSMKPAKLADKVKYLTVTLKRSMSEIVGFPFCLCFSLKRRIMKRFQYLQRIQFPHQSYSLPMVLSPSEERFYAVVEKELNKQGKKLPDKDAQVNLKT